MSMLNEIVVCYGIIISIDKIEEIQETIEEEEYIDLMDNDWLRCINGWTGDDYFLGVQVSLNSDLETPLLLEDIDKLLDNSLKKLKTFESILEKAPWKNLICWDPKKYLINFIY